MGAHRASWICIPRRLSSLTKGLTGDWQRAAPMGADLRRKYRVVSSLLLPPPQQLKSWCAIAANGGRRDSLGCSPRYNCTGHIHLQNGCGKGNNTEINSWYSLLQNIKEKLMKCLRWDHYKNPKFINWYHINWGKD